MKLEIVEVWCSMHENDMGCPYIAGYFTTKAAAEADSKRGIWNNNPRTKLVKILKITQSNGQVTFHSLGEEIAVHESEEAKLLRSALGKLNVDEIAVLKTYLKNKND